MIRGTAWKELAHGGASPMQEVPVYKVHMQEAEIEIGWSPKCEVSWMLPRRVCPLFCTQWQVARLIHRGVKWSGLWFRKKKKALVTRRGISLKTC